MVITLLFHSRHRLILIIDLSLVSLKGYFLFLGLFILNIWLTKLKLQNHFVIKLKVKTVGDLKGCRNYSVKQQHYY